MANSSFFKRYSLSIVMIPSIIGLHYVWSLMQKNRALVSAEEEIELPVVTFAKYCWRQVQGVTASEKSIEAAAKPSATAAAK